MDNTVIYENQAVKVSSNLAADNRAMKVWLWDLGPKQPVMPKRPARPHGKEGDPEYDLALIEFRADIEAYEAGLKAYKGAKEEYDAFQARWGGPYEFEQWSVDARDTLANDKLAVDEKRQPQLRYYVSSRTRGYERLPNGGLPKGVKPGHGHVENMRREEERSADLTAAMRADPVFGQEASP